MNAPRFPSIIKNGAICKTAANKIIMAAGNFLNQERAKPTVNIKYVQVITRTSQVSEYSVEKPSSIISSTNFGR